MFYILFYLQIWGDNHLILYGSAIFTAGSMIIYCVQEGHVDFSKVPYGVWNNLIVVVYSLITGSFIAYNYSTVVSSSITLAAYSIVCVSMCYVSSEEGSFEWVLKALVFLAFVCSLYAFFRGTVWEGYGRTLSSFNNPHVFAAVMNLGIFSAAYIIEDKERSRSLIYTALIVLFFYSIIASGSRKYLIASACLILIWAFTLLRVRWANGDTQDRLILIILLFVFVAVGIFIFRHMYVGSSMHQRMLDENDMGNQHRIRNYRKALEIFIENPLFGGGYDQFRYLSGAGGYAHSTYAEAIADFGLVGCIIYFTPIIVATYRIMHNAISIQRDYHSWLVFAFCISELFIGIGQIFFMEFYHFPAWMILFYNSQIVEKQRLKTIQQVKPISKYIRS